ncbi:MAG TPA: hypothetical protein VNT79_08240, partial [Phycisphaerae bacterium]|nr:hypothetical protein [Phycisphaerae bacterium]
GSDYHGINEHMLATDPAYRLLWTTPAVEQGAVRIRLFEKMRETAPRRRLTPIYPPRLPDKRPPITGIFYLLDAYPPHLPK